MEIIKGKLVHDLITAQLASQDGWLEGKGYMFSIEDLEFVAIPVPTEMKVMVFHFESGTHLFSTDMPVDVVTYADLLKFIEEKIMFNCCAIMLNEGKNMIEQEFAEMTKNTLERLGPKPDQTLLN